MFLTYTQDDDQALLSEYRQDVPPPGSDSEAEEDNSHHFEERVTEESPMVAVSDAITPEMFLQYRGPRSSQR